MFADNAKYQGRLETTGIAKNLMQKKVLEMGNSEMRPI